MALNFVFPLYCGPTRAMVSSFLTFLRSLITTHHNSSNSSWLVIISSQGPLPDQTQGHIHASDVIRTHDISRRATADLRLSWLQEGGQDRLAGSASMDALPTNRTWPPSRSHCTYQHKAITSRSRQLLMMGTWLPETCRATIRREIKNTKRDI